MKNTLIAIATVTLGFGAVIGGFNALNANGMLDMEKIEAYGDAPCAGKFDGALLHCQFGGNVVDCPFFFHQTTKS